MVNGWRKVPEWECLCLNQQQGPVLSECMDDIEIAGNESNLETQMERLMKHTDLEEQGGAPKLLQTAGIGMLPHRASSTSIPSAKILGRSSRTCGSSICADNHWLDFVTELDVDTLLCS